VKPGNVMVGEDGRPKLMDFGIARTLGHLGPGSDQSLDMPLMEGDGAALAQTLALRLTSSGDFLGSPAYAPPEVLRGSEGTPASDRYSFAATAFELLTGKLPHPGSGLAEIILHILQEPVAIPADVSPRMAAVFRRALAADPDDRYTTLPEFMEELIDALPGPVSMRARLFTFLGQDEDGTGSVSTARFRQVEAAPSAESGSHESRARGTAPLKIALAEDPVESYLSTRKRAGRQAGSDGPVTNWGQGLKWIVLAFIVLQLFWWLAPALSRLQF
jgi:serine/threonine-protein kinase